MTPAQMDGRTRSITPIVRNENALWLHLIETKFVAGRDNVQMRGRNSATKEIKSLQVKAGVTTIREIREFFDF